MEKAQWSPINSEHTSAANSPAAKKPHPGLSRLPINFSNGAPMRAKKPYPESPKYILEKPPVANSPTRSGDFPAPEAESRLSNPREIGVTSSSTVNETNSSTPFTTISPGEHTYERRVEGKRHDMESNGRNATSVASSRAGTQTPKAGHQIGVPIETRRVQPQKPNPVQEASEVYKAFNIPPPSNDLIVSEKEFNAIETSESRRGSVKRTPGPTDTPAGSIIIPPNKISAEPHEMPIKPIQNGGPIEIDEQSSSSSDDDTAHLSAGAGRNAEEAVEEVEGSFMDDPNHIATRTSLPDDHPIEWLVEAREMYQTSLPPFVTKQKLGIRRMVELPLAHGQQYAQKVEVVYRSWDVLHTFASIDVDGKRFIVKVFRGGATPYRPWLGPQTGFSETALAFSKQVSRGPKSLVASQGKRVSLPKGWALREEDERDDDYSPDSRRKSAPVRRRPRLNYGLNEEEELDGDPFLEDPYQVVEQPHSERSSIKGGYAAFDPSGDQPLDSNVSTTRPPSKLINAVKKSLRLPKEQDDFPRPKQIKRRSIGGQGVTTESGGNKRQKHKAVFSSDSENSVPHKRAKATKALAPHTFSSNPDDLKNVSRVSNFDHPTPDTQTLSPYKQSHTTLRIALIPYPLQSTIYRLRSCMTVATFFSTVIGVSGYKGDKDRIFGITATFDCKPDDDADKSMVIREAWQDSFDVFLETVDGAESWTEEGGKCSVAVNLLLTEG
ncbi:MAG: hypothetical protein ASARMPREDX12_002478 [Alectoria sarmentosa]|nr:MAG: hypothetical protein ASARMPREDX12_002478 [Alectoria sarmentosa]